METRGRIIRNVASTLEDLRGVLKVDVLAREESERILELEKEAEKRVLGGWGKGKNTGVREVIQREVAIALATDSLFKWPPESCVQLVLDGKVVGEEVRDAKKAEELERQGHRVLGGSFVIYKDRLQQARALKESLVVFPPLPFRPLANIQGISNVIAASVSPPADLFIREKMGIKGKGSGTMLIGFNLRED
ncbi:unnamed protein product [marine sediment metagenome]|uniref:Uncharacterized protein n=1 Tax=marine sediment metagenome TaxID=412755 RepID=X1MJP1_9ZZZZ